MGSANELRAVTLGGPLPYVPRRGCPQPPAGPRRWTPVVDRRKKREQMSVVELQELDEVKGLLAKGQQVGVLSFAEITKAMSELDLDESDVEELHGFLEKAEIELVEEIDPASTAASQVE